MDAGSFKVSQLILAHHHPTILHPAPNVEQKRDENRNENRKSTMKCEYTIVWQECQSRKCTYAPVYSFFDEQPTLGGNDYSWRKSSSLDKQQRH